MSILCAQEDVTLGLRGAAGQAPIAQRGWIDHGWVRETRSFAFGPHSGNAGAFREAGNSLRCNWLWVLVTLAPRLLFAMEEMGPEETIARRRTPREYVT
jgi:hypothetical protein